MARISFAPGRATAVTVEGQRVKMPVWGDPRRHDNWLNHPLYRARLSALDQETDRGCDGWEVVLPGCEKPWLAARFRATLFRGLGRHQLSPARPWMLVAPTGHDNELYIYPTLQQAVDAAIVGYVPGQRGRLRQLQEFLPEDAAAMAGLGAPSD